MQRRTMLRFVSTWILILTVIDNSTAGDERSWRLNRFRRSAHCELKYSTITAGHSACLHSSSIVREKGLEAGDKEVIVDIHNTARRDVSPQATNMVFMSWDDEIANTAQRWAENCVTDHDEGYKRYAFGRFSVGQNLAWSTGRKMTWTEAIKLWVDEKKDFHFGSSPTGVVGHYTQMVWADTSKVGCGYANCGGTYYYVCDYGPGGNSGDTTRPYKNGVPCSDCTSSCRQGLCYCSNIDVCLNGGTLDFDTCKCSCTKDLSFYLQPRNCALNCTGIQQPSYCGTQFPPSYCTRFSNVPQECPDMCGWCPAAGYVPVSSAPTTFAHTLTTSLIKALVLYCVMYIV